MILKFRVSVFQRIFFVVSIFLANVMSAAVMHTSSAHIELPTFGEADIQVLSANTPTQAAVETPADFIPSPSAVMGESEQMTQDAPVHFPLVTHVSPYAVDSAYVAPPMTYSLAPVTYTSAHVVYLPVKYVDLEGRVTNTPPVYSSSPVAYAGGPVTYSSVVEEPANTEEFKENTEEFKENTEEIAKTDETPMVDVVKRSTKSKRKVGCC